MAPVDVTIGRRPDLTGALLGDTDPAAQGGWTDHPPRMGFFTDTSVCIGCKACEVACKEWNAIPEDGLVFTGMSMDNTQGLGADTWRHVAFVEQRKPLAVQDPGVLHEGVDVLALAPQGSGTSPDEAGTTPTTPGDPGDLRWLMASDVCKHCTHAACLDVCPTGSLFRTEFGTVVVQEDICNGCGYCIPACPYGVIDQRKDDGRAWKCTLCYDRLTVGQEPACAKNCPTDSIQFGPLDELRGALAHDGLEPFLFGLRAALPGVALLLHRQALAQHHEQREQADRAQRHDADAAEQQRVLKGDPARLHPSGRRVVQAGAERVERGHRAPVRRFAEEHHRRRDGESDAEDPRAASQHLDRVHRLGPAASKVGSCAAMDRLAS